MFLLVRDVSPYTEWDPILLGIFTDEARAIAARLTYIDRTHGNDPWREQAYKDPDLTIDVRVTPIEANGSLECCECGYLVTRHLESMGQSYRWYLAIYAELDEALARAELEEAEEKVVAEYISVEEFGLNSERYLEKSALPFQEFGTGLWNPPET